MAYTLKPSGGLGEDNWKNVPYTFYDTVPKVEAGTENVVQVYQEAGTYTWRNLKEQKDRLQEEIAKTNEKMTLIEDEQDSGTVIP
jgi:predicted  nucleic acid-binding Zn-ribbon protein